MRPRRSLQRRPPVLPAPVHLFDDLARATFLGEADTVFPGLCLDDRVALDRQHVADELAALLVVFDNEDQLICHGTPEA